MSPLDADASSFFADLDRGRKQVTPLQRFITYAKTGSRCACCGLQFEMPIGYDGRSALVHDGYRDRRGHRRVCVLEVDHIVPVDLGGPHVVDNMQPLCTQCNARKGTQVINYLTPATPVRLGWGE